MTFKKPIYRILFFVAWILLLGGIATLVIAANGKTRLRVCKGVTVNIVANDNAVAVNKVDVQKTIEKFVGGSLMNKPLESVNLSALEKTLEANPWVSDAELYFDTKDVLNVSVSERVPVARVFTTAGTSFYIDSAGYKMPLLKAWTARLPVVTGFTPTLRWSAKDSSILRGVKEVVRFVSGDAFWNAQVGQIDITPEGKFELTPTVSDAVIRLGYADDIERKLANLMVFYQQVLPKAGFTKYTAVDVQFDGQVVAVKKGPTSVIDSIQLQKNITELMKRKEAEQYADSVEAAAPIISTQSVPEKDSLTKPASPPAPVASSTPQATTNSNPKPKTTTSTPAKPKAAQPKPTATKPKPQQTSPTKPRAVMPGRNEY